MRGIFCGVIVVAARLLAPGLVSGQTKAPAIYSVDAGAVGHLGTGGRAGLFAGFQYQRPIGSWAAGGVGLSAFAQSTVAPEVSLLIPAASRKVNWFTGVGAGYGVRLSGNGLHGPFAMIRGGVTVPIRGSLGGRIEVRLAKLTGSQGTLGIVSLGLAQYLDP